MYGSDFTYEAKHDETMGSFFSFSFLPSAISIIWIFLYYRFSSHGSCEVETALEVNYSNGLILKPPVTFVGNELVTDKSQAFVF